MQIDRREQAWRRQTSSEKKFAKATLNSNDWKYYERLSKCANSINRIHHTNVYRNLARGAFDPVPFFSILNLQISMIEIRNVHTEHQTPNITKFC